MFLFVPIEWFYKKFNGTEWSQSMNSFCTHTAFIQNDLLSNFETFWEVSIKISVSSLKNCWMSLNTVNTGSFTNNDQVYKVCDTGFTPVYLFSRMKCHIASGTRPLLKFNVICKQTLFKMKLFFNFITSINLSSTTCVEKFLM